MAPTAFRRPRWSTPTTSSSNASSFIHERIGTPAIAEQYIEGREIYVGVIGNERLRVLPVWELRIRQHGGGRLADRHREGQARSRLSGAPRHPARAGQESDAGTRRPHPAHGQAHLPDAGTRRLCPHRFPAVRRRHAVFPRSQSQSRNRRKPGIRLRGAARRHQISRPAAPHSGARHAPRGGAAAAATPRADARPDAAFYAVFRARDRVPGGLADMVAADALGAVRTLSWRAARVWMRGCARRAGSMCAPVCRSVGWLFRASFDCRAPFALRWPSCSCSSWAKAGMLRQGSAGARKCSASSAAACCAMLDRAAGDVHDIASGFARQACGGASAKRRHASAPAL